MGTAPAAGVRMRGGYALYGRRWAILLAFCLLAASNGWMWITWSVIEEDVAKLWGVSTSSVNMLSTVYMFVYVPASVPCLALMTRWGLRKGLFIAVVLNFVGSVLRWRGYLNYSMVFAGTFVAALAQGFTLASPPLISNKWFGSGERSLACAIGVLWNQIGIAVGMGATIVLTNFDATTQLQPYLLLQCIIAGVCVLLIAVFVKDNPPTPPSASAASVGDENVSYWGSVRKFVGSRDGFILCMTYGVQVGSFYAFSTFLSQMVPAWPASSRGTVGLAVVLVGVVGSLIAGLELQARRRFRRVVLICMGGVVLSMGAWLVCVELSGTEVAPAGSAAAMAGLFMTAVTSSGLDFAVEVSWPANEASVAGVLNSCAQIWGCILIWSGSALLTGTNGVLITNSLITALCAVSWGFALLLSGECKREATDQLAGESSTASPYEKLLKQPEVA